MMGGEEKKKKIEVVDGFKMKQLKASNKRD